ncbi:phage/plasmid replication protein [Chromobacterium vaccinii]|uniref:phage/plasmid replication domain-containing protein n=1 Tax=Chromobacterium vaccinii TaxID=1108595 RepID=UPI000617E3EB|nr:phage/plasmid replication protein [Chromobacterium vaccinii]
MNSLFIDSITISQTYPGRYNPDTGEVEPTLPLVDSGVVGKWGRDMETGELVEDAEWGQSSKLFIRGSFDSLVVIKSDGFRVSLTGNIGRLDRADNLFNLDWDATIAKCNEILGRFRLPPFTKGEQVVNANPSAYDLQHGINLIKWTGAKVSNFHVTENLATGSPENAAAFMGWASTQSMNNIKRNRTCPESCSWGSKAGRKMFKLYIKHLEMLAPGHMHGRSKTEIKTDPVYQFAKEQGIVRAELEAGRLLLRDKSLQYLGDITMEKIVALFRSETQPLLNRVREDITRLDIEGLPSKIRMTAACYLRGEDVRPLLSQATFYRHAKQLREYGIDINEPLAKFEKINHVIKVIEVKPLECPEWYWAHQQRLYVDRVRKETAESLRKIEQQERMAAVAANEQAPALMVSNGNVIDDPDRLAAFAQALGDYKIPARDASAPPLESAQFSSPSQGYYQASRGGRQPGEGSHGHLRQR